MQIQLNGKNLTLTPLARGTFSKVYTGDDGLIYVLMPARKGEQDYSKEAIAEFATGEHIPTIARHGEMYAPRLGYCDIYSMPQYHKLTGTAKRQALELRRAWQKYHDQNWRNMLKTGWYNFNFAMLESFRQSGIDAAICDAIGAILDACSNYGDTYNLEFPLRNMRQDENGRLILLDIIYNVEALR